MAEQQNVIQQARDVLDKRRKLAIAAQKGDSFRFEPVGKRGDGIIWRDFEFFGQQHEVIAENVYEGDAALISLMISPPVLDVLIEFLDDALFIRSEGDIKNTLALTMRADRIAAAIVSADERMSA